MIVINFKNGAGESILIDKCLQNGAGFIIYTSPKQSESFKEPVDGLFIQIILTTRSIAAQSTNNGIDMVNLVKEIYHAYRTELCDASVVDIFTAAQGMLTAVLHSLKNDQATANCARTMLLVGIRAVALNNSTGYLIDEFDNEIINIKSCVAGPGVLAIFKNGDCCYYNFYDNNWHHFIEPLFNTKKRYNGVFDFIGKVYLFGKYVSPNYLEMRFENAGVHVDEEIYNDILCREIN